MINPCAQLIIRKLESGVTETEAHFQAKAAKCLYAGFLGNLTKLQLKGTHAPSEVKQLCVSSGGSWRDRSLCQQETIRTDKDSAKGSEPPGKATTLIVKAAT